MRFGQKRGHGRERGRDMDMKVDMDTEMDMDTDNNQISELFLNFRGIGRSAFNQ